MGWKPLLLEKVSVHPVSKYNEPQPYLARSNPPSSSSSSLSSSSPPSPGLESGGGPLASFDPSASSGSSRSEPRFRDEPRTCACPVPGRLGLTKFGGGGLLLSIPPAPRGSPLIGLVSCMGRAGVLPISANFQNCAGELMGMNFEGICAVLGGGSRGCWRCGAGVIIDDGPSS